MASGDLVGFIYRVSPPGANGATADVRAGGSTPTEQVTVWDFDDSTIEYLDFYAVLLGYDGGGLTVDHDWSATTATTGVTRWGGAFRRINDDAEDADTSHTYDYNDADDTTASASGEISRATITFTDGADADSLADGERFIYRVRRNASHANDTMSGDAELWGVPVIKET